MNELSTEVKAKETHEKAVSYFGISEQYGYKFIMEVKKIREEKLFKGLGYKNFNEYSQSAWGVDQYYLSERIKIAETFNEEDFFGYNQKLGHRKTLFLARMDKPQREQAINEGIPTEQGNKPIDEATQQEINDFRRKNREIKKQLEQAKKSEEIALGKLEEMEEMEDVEPQVIEKEIEVIPDDYDYIKGNFEEAQNMRDRYKEQLEEMREELNNASNPSIDSDEMDQELKVLEYDSTKTVLTTKIKIDDFLKDVAVTSFRKGAIASSSQGTRDKLQQGVEELEEFCKEMRTALRGRVEITKQEETYYE